MVHYYSFRQKRVLSSHYGSGCVHWCISHRVVLPYTAWHGEGEAKRIIATMEPQTLKKLKWNNASANKHK